MSKPQNGFAVRMKSEDVVELQLYGTIMDGAQPYWDEDDYYIYSGDVVKELSQMRTPKLRMLMSSMGGDVNATFAMCNRLQKQVEEGHIGEVETVAEGTVASAMTLMFLKGSTRMMRSGTRFMIHRPMAFGVGDFAALSDQSARLEKRTAEVAKIYASMCSLSEKEVDSAMAAETYYYPDDAVELGFATAKDEAFAIAAYGRGFADRMLKNVPKDIEFEPEKPAEAISLDEMRNKMTVFAGAS